MDRQIIQKSGQCFSDSEKHLVIAEYLNSNSSKREIWYKYTGQTKEHGYLLNWMRQLGYATSSKNKTSNIVVHTNTMSKKKISEQDFENLQLQKRVASLEKQLKEAELKAIAFSTMVDIAEDMFKIPIRKKLNTKP